MVAATLRRRPNHQQADVLSWLNRAMVGSVGFMILLMVWTNSGNPSNSSASNDKKAATKSSTWGAAQEQEQEPIIQQVVPMDDDFFVGKQELPVETDDEMDRLDDFFHGDDDWSASPSKNKDTTSGSDSKNKLPDSEPTKPAPNDDQNDDIWEGTDDMAMFEMDDDNVALDDKNPNFVENYCDLSSITSTKEEEEEWWPLETDWKVRAPRFLLIGAKKAGTTSLSSWLSQHPNILPPRTKELLYFLPSRFRRYDASSKKAQVANIRSDLYGPENFDKTGLLQTDDTYVTFESTPGYLLYSKRSRIPILCAMPWVKLLVTLRNPVDRVYSNYNFVLQHINAKKPMTLEQFIEKDFSFLRKSGVIPFEDEEEEEIIRFYGSHSERKAWDYYQELVPAGWECPVGRGLYVLQLQEWFDALRELGKDPDEDVLVVRNEDMKSRPNDVYQSILWWLELPAWNHALFASKMVTKYSALVMSNQTRKKLTDFYRPYNERLYEMLGGDWDERVWDNTHQDAASKLREQALQDEEQMEAEEEEAIEANMDSKELVHLHDPPNLKDKARVQNFTSQWCVFGDAKTSWYPPPHRKWELRAPYFILPGAKKSGTTSLSSYISQHPLVERARTKELQFFLNKNFRKEYVTSDRKTLVKKAREHMYSMEYHSRVLQRNSSLISMDATPGYLFFSAMLPQRLLCVSPWIKLVIILRNPVDRTYSNYQYVVWRSGHKIDFDKFIKFDMNQLVKSGFLNATSNTPKEADAWKDYLGLTGEGPVGRSLYEIQLRQWFQAIRDVGRDPKEAVHIVRSEDLKNDVEGEMKKVYKFLGLPYVPIKNEKEKMVNHYDPIEPAARKELDTFFKPYNKKLYKFLEKNGFGSDWQGYWDKKR